MNRFLLLITSLFFIRAINADAQNFLRTYGSPTIDEGGQTIIASPDGNFFLGGYRGDSALVMKVDPSGEPVWAKTFKTTATYKDIVFQLAISPDGFLLGCGGTMTTASNPYRGLFYFKFDAAGNVIWIKHSSDTRSLFCRSILPVSSEEYVLINEIYDLNSSTFSDPIQQGVSALDGSILWTGPRYDFPPSSSYIDDAYGSALGLGKSNYVTGRTYLGGSDPSSMRAYIAKFDSIGNNIWTKYYVSSPPNDARIYGIDIIYNNDSLTMAYFGNISAYSDYFQVGIIHTDTLGNFIWGKNYQINSFTTEYAFKVVKMPYGYAITGYGTGSGNDLFVIAVSNLGDMIWAKRYGSSATIEDLLYTASTNAVADGSDLLFTGRSGTASNKDLILVRVDQNGALDCGESNDISVTTTGIPSYTATLTPTAIVDDIAYVPVTAASSPVITDECNSLGAFLGNDQTSCSPIILTAPSLGPGTTYQWQNGATSAMFTANTPGTYWVQLSLGCCTATDSVVINAGTVAIADFSPSLDPCSFLVSTTNSSTGGTSYAWTFGDGQTSSANHPHHVYTTPGTYDITLTATNGCGSQDTTIEVQILPLGSFSISGPDTLCADQGGAYSAYLSNASLSSIAWASGADSIDILFASSENTALYALATDSNNCTYSDTLLIHINPGPQANFTFNTPSCDSLITFLNGSINATDLQWDLGNGENSTVVSPVGHYGGFGNYTIELIAVNACGSDTLDQQLTLGPTGTLVLLGPDSMCVDQPEDYSVEIQGLGISIVQWSLDNSDSTSIALSLSSDSILFVTVMGDDGCQYSDSILIQVLPLPSVSFELTPIICAHTVITTNASIGASSYEWDFGDGQSSDVDQPTHVYDGYGTYEITLTATNGCGIRDTTAAIALVTPGVFSISGPDTLCEDQTGVYNSALADASLESVTWNSGSDSASTTFSSSVTAVLYAIAMDSSNCIYTDTMLVHISPNPIAAFSFNPLPCDSVVNFSDNSTEASSWEWDLGNGMSSTLPFPSGHYPDFGTYTVQEVVLNACGSDTASQQLTLGPLGTLDLSGPDSICTEQMGAYSIDLVGSAVSNVQWSLDPSDSSSISLSLSNSSMLEVTVLGSDGCIYEDSLAIQVLPLPIAAFSTLANPCDSAATFSNASFYADNYTWDFGNGETSNAPSPSSTFDTSVLYEVTLVVSNGCGTDTTQQALAFDSIPYFELVGPSSVCSDRPVEFHISYAGTGMHDLLWSTGDTTATITISTEDGEVIHVVAMDDLGCILESSYVVHYVGDGGVGAAYIPNVFTPNKDGLNESFAPVILQGFISMEIFNRWGQEIYTTTQGQKPWFGDFNGLPVPDGTYVYIIKWKDQCVGSTVSRTGHVTVLR